MLSLLTQFSALTLISGMVTALLPEGTLRRTTYMVVGLMLLLFWAEGISEAFGTLTLPQGQTADALTHSGLALDAAQDAAILLIQGDTAP